MSAEYTTDLAEFRYEANRMRADDGEVVGVEVSMYRKHAPDDDDDVPAAEFVGTAFLDPDSHADFYFSEDGVHVCDPVELGALAGAFSHVWAIARDVLAMPEKVERRDVN